MTATLCLVQQGQISAAQEESLRSQTSAFAERNFGAPAAINWIVVGEGDGYTEGKLSTSVIVSMASDRALSPSEREPLLRELGDIWQTHAGKSPDEVVSVISNPQG